MKKRFFKKLKKIILILSCVLSCLVIFTVSVSAESDIDFLINSGDMVLQCVSRGVPGLNGASFSQGYVGSLMVLDTLLNSAGTVQSSSTNYYKNASYIEDRLEIWASSKTVFINKGSSFEGMFSGFTSEWFFNGNTLITLNSNVNVTFSCDFRDSSTKKYYTVYPSSFSISDSFFSFKFKSIPCDTDLVIFNIRYSVSDPYLKNGSNTLKSLLTSGTFNYHAFRFENLDFNLVSSIPASYDQPNYSQPSSGDIDNTTSQEQIIVENSVQDAQNEFGKLSNSIANIVQDTKLYNSILGVRFMFERLLQESSFLSDILVVSLICGVVLLFSNFIVNRRRD